jgi:hypothetical protein
VSALQRLRQAVESSGRRFELIIPPDKSTQLPEHLPQNYAGKACSVARSDQFWARATRDLGVIDLRTSLAEAAQRAGHPFYDPDDTHWTFEGGVTMTYALAEKVAPGTTSSWLVQPGKIAPWPADIALFLGEHVDRKLQTFTLAPDGKTDRARYVASDFRSPLRLTQPNTAQAVPGVVTAKVGLIADSFTQFASPFLAAGFSDTVIVHDETMAQDPTGEAAQLLVDRDVIAVELAERNTVGGASPLLQDSVINAIAKVLAQNPR